MESKLTKLLAPLEKDEQSLMKLDAIFAVSVCLLEKNNLEYCWCCSIAFFPSL